MDGRYISLTFSALEPCWAPRNMLGGTEGQEVVFRETYFPDDSENTGSHLQKTGVTPPKVYFPMPVPPATTSTHPSSHRPWVS